MLFVCTGNVCRSPVAARLFGARIGIGDVTVSSAGTHPLTGYGIDGPSAFALRELGVDSAGHQAQRATIALTAQADLILAAQGGHRSTLVQAEPLVFRRAFTIREFARLGAELGPLDGPATAQTLRERVLEVAGQRGLVEPAEPGADDVGDPFGADLEVARACVSIISDSVDGVIRALGVRSAAPRPA